MDSLNILRAVLVAGTFVAAILLAVEGQWLPAALLGAGILAHFGLWAHLYREKRRAREHAAALEGTTGPPR